MGPSLSARTKTDTRNAVASHDGNAVGGEGPLIGKEDVLSHLCCCVHADTLVAEQVLISFFQGLGNLVVLRDNPGWEVALDWICKALIGRTGILIHGYGNIIAVLF